MEAVIFDLLLHVNSHVQNALNSISLTAASPIFAFIIDFFCHPALPIGLQLDIPTYFFYTSGVCSLALFLHLPTLDKRLTESFKDMDENVHLPSLPPIPASHMPTPILDRTSMEYEYAINMGIRFQKSSGILVNTFASLESKTVEACSAGLFTPDATTPPIYCIGPLIASSDGRKGSSKDGGVDECLKWLDNQPTKSVVYLSFGSLGVFSAEQIREIAIGLERSEQRFLWVVRSPPSQDKSKRFLPPPVPDLEMLLPDGFMERTKGKGLVVKSWAPQVKVLNHESVGGFVTHCGWNSVLEAIMAGVPMVAWPIYAEQKFNSIILTQEMELALPINQTEGGIVMATEIEKRVRELMESEEGKVVREIAQKYKKEAKEALIDGGASISAMADWVTSWKIR